MGADRAIHLTDRHFGGSDTYATSHILATAIKKAGPFDLVITGERATDGDTAQVGPAIAAWLDLGLVTYVSTIKTLKQETLRVERLVEEGYQEVAVRLPALITVVKEVAIPRLPTLSNKRRSLTTTIESWGVDDLDVDRAKIGLKGSPTRVVKIETPKVARTCIIHRAEGDEQVRAAVDRLIDYLEEKHLLDRNEGARHG